MINTRSVLEHIAQTTSKSLEDIENDIYVYYWKDVVNFIGRRGYSLLADYLRGQGITKLERYGNHDLCAHIPMNVVNPKAYPNEFFTVYISFPVTRKFEKEYPEFEFPH